MKNENNCTRDIQKFRQRLEELRGNTPQKDFCKDIGVTVRTYQNWVNPLYQDYKSKKYSYTLPKIEVAMRICDKYHVSLDYLFGRIDNETITNKNISDLTGLDDEAIRGLGLLKNNDELALSCEQPSSCVLPILNRLLSPLLSYSFRHILQGIRNFITSEYCIPVHYTGRNRTKNNGVVTHLEYEVVPSGEGLDAAKPTIKDKNGKILTAEVQYYAHFAKDMNNLQDNVEIPVTREFIQAVAMQTIERALIGLSENNKEKFLNGSSTT